MNAPALARLLDVTADAVQAVREGRSLSEALPRVPQPLRPGVQALAFTVLRRLGGALEVRERLAPRRPPPPVESLLLVALALLWPPQDDGAPPYADHTLVDQAVAAARQRTPAAAGFINAVLRRFVRERMHWVQAALHTPLGAYNHPDWWVQRLRHDWPGQWQQLLAHANRHPPMALRVNARRTTPARYVELLAHHGIVARMQPLPGAAAAGLDDLAVVLAKPCPVLQLPGFADGEVSVQDAAAQLAAPLLLGGGRANPTLPPLPAGARVLDACAAPGGKTAHLLERADLDLLALDVDAGRLARVHDNLRRLRLPGTGRVQVRAGDAGQPGGWWDARPFDAILLDAPCTASGIVRRHPDVRWLRRPADVDTLAQTQQRLLQALWPLLAPGGRLLYATCSLFRAEGEHQIDAFLQRLPAGGARRWPLAPGHLLPLPDNPAGGEATAGSVPTGPAAWMPPPAVPVARPPPAPTGDGFFYALIEKT
ncbi:MAG: 16S rRNA (cytosine(967)-C(5))-methyltransferase RsmB [Rubrivivax sp.]|nr:16S rRNA (cytosine(967)-C(5))-methyltransferase RsmB [Rubrivivax sp.]